VQAYASGGQNAAFAASQARFTTMVAWLGDEQHSGMTHAQVEERLHTDGLALLRQLFQDSLDLRAGREPRLYESEKNHAHRPWYSQHPPHVIVREDLLLPPVARFFKNRIFGSTRKILLEDSTPAGPVDPQLDARRAAVQAELADLQRRQNNLMQELERFTPSGDPDLDDAWRGSIQARFAANAAEQRTKNRLLTDLTREQQQTAPPDISLIDALPLGAIDITLLPEEQQRRLYDAFHLEVRYDLPEHAVILRATIDAETAPALLDTIDSQTRPPTTPIAATAQSLSSPEPLSPVPRQAGWDALRFLPGIRTCATGRTEGFHLRPDASSRCHAALCRRTGCPGSRWPSRPSC